MQFTVLCPQFQAPSLQKYVSKHSLHLISEIPQFRKIWTFYYYRPCSQPLMMFSPDWLMSVLWNLECFHLLVNEFCPVPSWLTGIEFLTSWKGNSSRVANRGSLMSPRVPDGVKQGIEKWDMLWEKYYTG